MYSVDDVKDEETEVLCFTEAEWWHSGIIVAWEKMLSFNAISSGCMRCHQEFQSTYSSWSCARKKWGRHDYRQFSINETRMKERLLCDNELTLHKATEICKSTELAKTQIQAMQIAPVVQGTSVDAIKKTKEQIWMGDWNKDKRNKKHITNECHKCGNRHEPRQCPAYGAVCHNL